MFIRWTQPLATSSATGRSSSQPLRQPVTMLSIASPAMRLACPVFDGSVDAKKGGATHRSGATSDGLSSI